jgi:tartrate dehydrogenase/decarboxylase/D-malate dehydrogenase
MMPDDWFDAAGRLRGDLLRRGRLAGAVPDHISLWGSLLKFRREFDQYVNLRPVRLMPGVPCPLANKQPGDIDFYVVRENTEGEYSSVGGRMFEGTEREFVLQESCSPATAPTASSIRLRTGAEPAEEAPDLGHQVERHLDQHAVLGRARGGHGRTTPTSNGTSTTSTSWRALRAVAGALRRGGGVEPVRRHPVRPGPACTGTIGIAPSANLNPERQFPSLFEPVHGSAPDIYGKNIANPIAMIWSGAMMLDFLGNGDASYPIVAAIESWLLDGNRTPDMGGTASTTDAGKAIARGVEPAP